MQTMDTQTGSLLASTKSSFFWPWTNIVEDLCYSRLFIYVYMWDKLNTFLNTLFMDPQKPPDNKSEKKTLINNLRDAGLRCDGMSIGTDDSTSPPPVLQPSLHPSFPISLPPSPPGASEPWHQREGGSDDERTRDCEECERGPQRARWRRWRREEWAGHM